MRMKRTVTSPPPFFGVRVMSNSMLKNVESQEYKGQKSKGQMVKLSEGVLEKITLFLYVVLDTKLEHKA
jgi:hypothetical protein